MKIRQVLNCSFSSWYGNHKKETFRSEVIPIPADVVKYLLSDGIVLPKSAQNGTYTTATPTTDCNTISSDSGDEVVWDEDSDDDSQAPYFPEFEEKVTAAVKKLGGRVFAKLNWSSPRDATWIAFNNSLLCQTLGDIFLLLKSSDFITRDLTQPFLYCDNCGEAADVEYDLVLRRWCDVSPSGEFRCFVKNNQLIAICQRAHSVHFPHIEKQKDSILHDIVEFYQDCILDKFPDNDYVFDVYRLEEGKVKLVDFNPFGNCTDPLLYTWSEVRTLADNATESSALPDFRHVTENLGVQPSQFQAYALPRDVVDLCSGEDINKLVDVMRIRQNIAVGSSSDEDAP